MDDEKKKQVYRVLIMPIFVTKHSGFNENKSIEIYSKNEAIYTTQSYWQPYVDIDTGQIFRYDINLDCDMSDFACGFYEIIYKKILNNCQIVDGEGGLINNQFAGDTMNSVSRIPGLKDKYHCLANFWMIPMELGRKSKSVLSKTSNKYDILDFMDRFLILMKFEWNKYLKDYNEYFGLIDTFINMKDIHFLSQGYIDQKGDVLCYSDQVCEKTSEYLWETICTRAKMIAESEYVLELWNYFNSYKLFD